MNNVGNLKEYKVLWLDDDQNAIKKSSNSLKRVFNEKFNSKITFRSVNSSKSFFKSIDKKSIHFDFIFLDIDLNDPTETGIDIYEMLRQKKLLSIVVFVSANLNVPQFEEKVELLIKSDEDLFELPIPFPNHKEQQDYNEKVLFPAQKITQRFEKKLFEITPDFLLAMDENYRNNYLHKILDIDYDFVSDVFMKENEVNSIICGDSPQNILYKGYNGKHVTSEALLGIAKIYNKAVFGYNRGKKKDHSLVTIFDEGRIISHEVIIAEILEVEDNIVTLNCLIDKDNLVMEVRHFDIEPLINAVPLNIGNCIRINIVTRKGIRTFQFCDSTEDDKKYFEKRHFFDSENFSDFINP
jgi:hypothetical protein